VLSGDPPSARHGLTLENAVVTPWSQEISERAAIERYALTFQRRECPGQRHYALRAGMACHGR
jgi:hypothetical protein